MSARDLMKLVCPYGSVPGDPGANLCYTQRHPLSGATFLSRSEGSNPPWGTRSPCCMRGVGSRPANRGDGGGGTVAVLVSLDERAAGFLHSVSGRRGSLLS